MIVACFFVLALLLQMSAEAKKHKSKKNRLKIAICYWGLT